MADNEDRVRVVCPGCGARGRAASDRVSAPRACPKCGERVVLQRIEPELRESRGGRPTDEVAPVGVPPAARLVHMGAGRLVSSLARLFDNAAFTVSFALALTGFVLALFVAPSDGAAAARIGLAALAGFLGFFASMLYLAPTAVAYERGSEHKLAIFLLNVLVGWAVVGWIVALIGACVDKPPRPRCPFCRSRVDPAAVVCPFCNRDIEPA